MARFFEYRDDKFINLSDVRHISVSDEGTAVDIDFRDGDPMRLALNTYQSKNLMRELHSGGSIVPAPPGYQLALYNKSGNTIECKCPVIAMRIRLEWGVSHIELMSTSGASSGDDGETGTKIIIAPDGRCHYIEGDSWLNWFDNENELLEWLKERQPAASE
jgi:hypothetical protein